MKVSLSARLPTPQLAGALALAARFLQRERSAPPLRLGQIEKGAIAHRISSLHQQDRLVAALCRSLVQTQVSSRLAAGLRTLRQRTDPTTARCPAAYSPKSARSPHSGRTQPQRLRVLR